MIYLIFYLSIFLILYNLIFYPLFLYIISKFFKQKELPKLTEFPSVTVVCPAYNEEKVIGHKIESFIALNYPKDKIKMIVISDDSTDKTNEIVEEYAKENTNISLIIQKPRKGKVSGLNMIEHTINTDYVLSTDATSIFDKDAIIHLMQKMLSDSSIGFVGGNMRFSGDNKTSGEDTYYSVENKIKYWESTIKSTVSSNGVLFLIKRSLFTKMHPKSPDDFERVLYTLKKKFKVKFIPEAFVYEEVQEKALDEFSRKTRIISTSWSAFFRQIAVMNPFKYPLESFFIFSHKVLRWLIGFLSLGIFVSTAGLISIPFFKMLFIFELFVLILGIFELLLQSKNKTSKIGKFPGYFISMNLASIVGFYKFITGKYSATWTTKR